MNRRCRRGRHKLTVIKTDDQNGRTRTATASCIRPGCTYRSGPWTMPFAETKARGGSFRGVRRED